MTSGEASSTDADRQIEPFIEQLESCRCRALP
jgi:hypothetical protein